MASELECKLPIPSREELAAKLLALGGVAETEVFERNWVYDTPAADLRQRLLLLRVRTHDGEPGGVLTVKRPAPEQRFKHREELETRIADAATMRAALTALGFEVAWYYEKKRRYLTLGGCHIALDELPELGCYIEIEGPDEAVIAKLLGRLGLDPAAHETLNYLGLFAEYCRERGEVLRAMKF